MRGSVPALRGVVAWIVLCGRKGVCGDSTECGRVHGKLCARARAGVFSCARVRVCVMYVMYEGDWGSHQPSVGLTGAGLMQHTGSIVLLVLQNAQSKHDNFILPAFFDFAFSAQCFGSTTLAHAKARCGALFQVDA